MKPLAPPVNLGDVTFNPATLFLTWFRDPTTTMTVQWVGTRGETPDATAGSCTEFRNGEPATNWSAYTNSHAFTVDGTSTDGQSAIQKLNFPTVSGMTGGGDDSSSPYQGSYSWTASTTASMGRSRDVVAFMRRLEACRRWRRGTRASPR